MLNGGETPSKRSKIEKETNVNVAANFVLLIIMCSACAVVGGIFLNRTDTSRNFYEPGALDSDNNILNALIVFGTCLVLFQNIVPISLYISIELTKVRALAGGLLAQCADACPLPPDDLGLLHLSGHRHVLRAAGPSLRAQDVGHRRRPRADRVHLLRQDGHAHAERHGVQEVLHQRL